MVRITRQESRDITRQKLREAALSEFARHGVAAGSIDRITDAAGYSRGAFYANYASKSELALELLSNNSAREIATWKQLVEQAHTPQALLGHLEAHFDHLSTQREWWLLGLELRAEAERDPEFREAYEAAELNVMAQLRLMVQSLCRYVHGEDRDDPAEVEYIAVALHTFTHGLPFERARLTLAGTTPGKLLVRVLIDLLGHPAKLNASPPG